MSDIFSFITEQEAAYELPIEPIDGWSWNMKRHIRDSALIKNSQFTVDNENRTKRPNKNIVLPLLRIQYRLEGFDVKDIDIYVTNPDKYHKSFVIKKYHDKWAKEQGIDTLIDNIVWSYVDYGGVLVKNGKKIEVVDMQSLAFADQTNILKCFAIKHYYSPDELRAQTSWDKNAIDMAILQIEYAKHQDKQGIKSDTPIGYAEVYEVHGTFPNSWLGGDDNENYSRQIHIISFYKDKDNQKKGLIFWKKKEPEGLFKFLARDGGIFGRALGFGGVEELFEPQAWTNYAEIKIAHMLDAASKVIHLTTDPQFKNRNSIDDLDDNSILTLQEGRDFRQMDTTPRNMKLFYQSIDTFKDNADRLAAAGDALQGEQPKSNTPFKLQELITIENKGMHNFRKGQIATFMDEIYRDWVLPKLYRDVQNEKTFLSLLSADELQEVAEKVVANKGNEKIIDMILNLEIPQDIEQTKQQMFADFVKGGRKRFFRILKGEMDEEFGVETNIANKQKDLSLITDKMVNVIRQIIATPQILQDPQMVSLFNAILESSGLSPFLFKGQIQQPPQQGGTEGLAQLSKTLKVKETANA